MEFDLMCQGYQRRHAHAWEPIRWLGALLVNINRGKDDPATRPEELLWLPGEPAWVEGRPPGPAVEVMSPEEFDRIANGL